MMSSSLCVVESSALSIATSRSSLVRSARSFASCCFNDSARLPRVVLVNQARELVERVR